ncbi:MAG: hypothetical protein LBR31_09165 [Desulfovibrio sp.]|jgi:hypothetical protein|nr:hypothetical protein [Desulfovibrio sp.]
MSGNFDLMTVSPVKLTVTALCMAGIWLFASEIAQAAIAFGEIGQNVAENAKGVAKGITMTGYATGAGMGVWGGVEMYKATKNQGQASHAGGLLKILIGGGLLALGEVLGSGSATLFGSDQTSGLGELGL